MDATKGPQVALTLDWRGDLRFEGEKILLDGDGRAGPSPVQALGYALAGCMGADLVDIIRKGRFPLKSVRIDLHGERAATQPKRLLKVSLHFHIEGDVPEDRVEAEQDGRTRNAKVV